MKKMLLVSLMLAVALITVPAFAGPTFWHVNGTVVGGAANLTGAIGGSVGYTSATAGKFLSTATATENGSGSGLGVNSSNSSYAIGGAGGSSQATAASLTGNALATASNTNFGAGVAVKGFFVGGVVSGGAFGF